MKLVPSSFSRSLDSRSQDPFAVKAIGCADPKGSVSEWRRSQVCRTSLGSPFLAVSIPISSTKGSNLKILDSDFLKIRQIETQAGEVQEAAPVAAKADAPPYGAKALEAALEPEGLKHWTPPEWVGDTDRFAAFHLNYKQVPDYLSVYSYKLKLRRRPAFCHEKPVRTQSAFSCNFTASARKSASFRSRLNERKKFTGNRAPPLVTRRVEISRIS